MTCNRVMERLMSYHDGELTGHLAREIRAHLAECSDCSATLRMLDETDRAAGIDMPDEAYFDGLTARVMEAVRREKAEAEEKAGQYWWHRLTRIPVMRLAPALSLALVIVVAIGVWYRTGEMKPPRLEVGREAVPGAPAQDEPSALRGDVTRRADREAEDTAGNEGDADDLVLSQHEQTAAPEAPAEEGYRVPARTKEAGRAAVSESELVEEETRTHGVAGNDETSSDGERRPQTVARFELPVTGNRELVASGEEMAPEGEEEKSAKPVAAKESGGPEAGEGAVAAGGEDTPAASAVERSADGFADDISEAALNEPLSEPVSAPATGKKDSLSPVTETPVVTAGPASTVETKTPVPETVQVIDRMQAGAGEYMPPEVQEKLDSYFGRGNYVIIYNRDINNDGIDEIVAVEPLNAGGERSTTYDRAVRTPRPVSERFSRGLVVQKVNGSVRQQLLIGESRIEDRLQNRLPVEGTGVVYTLRQDMQGDPRNLVLNTIPESGVASSDQIIRWDPAQEAYVLEVR